MPIDNEPVYRSSVDNYDLTDIDGIEADIAAMEEFAAGLRADLEQNYMPHADRAAANMLAELPTNGEFYELYLFLGAHRQVQDATFRNVDSYIAGTYQFATSAEEISAKYRGADAFSRAKLSDVQAAFEGNGTL
ncbi:hypothetical protein [Actinoplanes subglobosus]|uniref:Uncharacterized protein n=1 Tax=Actinoplanes subglobosus TaxID=1547892 RepID=A0ABV8ITD8_9ACTN